MKTNRYFSEKVQRQVDEILSQMSLAQKIGQMTQADRMTCTPEQVYEYGLGSVLSSAGSCPDNNTVGGWLEMCEAYWAAGMKPRADGPRIPLLYGLDAVHGHGNVQGATIFPHNIGLGATHDPKVATKIAEITRREVMATGIDWVFGPNLAVARDKHWGRTYESFSESPELVAKFAGPVVSKLQNDLHMDSVVACAKHWLGDGGTQLGIDQGNTMLSLEDLKKLHVPPYKEAIEAGVLTIMASFSSWNGTKCHANKFLLTDLLKKELGFQGFIVSDMQGIDFVDDDFYLAIEKSVNAGIDMFMLPENWRSFIEHLTTHVEMGTVSLSRINDAVRRILMVKIAYGLFEKPSPKNRIWANHASFASEEHKAIARDAVAKSLVLLKNDNHILPLNPQANILVCGKNAHNIGHQCGGFTITWQGESGNDTIAGDSIWQGIKEQCPNATLVTDQDIKTFETKAFDVALVVVGEQTYAEGMGDIRAEQDDLVSLGAQISGYLNVVEPQGASIELCELYPEDYALITSLVNKGIPVVTVLVSGRPLLINKEIAKSDAFVAAWLPGSEGKGVADVLFGKEDFHGRLAFTWPQKSRPALNVGDDNYNPLFPFGFGLSYREQLREKQANG